MDTLHENKFTFTIIFCLILLRMKNVSDKGFRENQNPHFMFFSKIFFQKSCCLLHHVEKYGRARQAAENNIIQHMHIACWKTKAEDTGSEYVILMVLPWKQWLCESTSVLYVHGLSCARLCLK